MPQDQGTRQDGQAPVDEQPPDDARSTARGGGSDRGLGAAYAGIAVGALAVVGATAVGLRWAAHRPPSGRTLTVGPGWVTFRGATPLRPRR